MGAVDDVGRVAAEALVAPIPGDGAIIELIGDLRSLRDCRDLLATAGRRTRRAPIPRALFRSMVGDELTEMWRWLTTLDEIPITPGVRDVPAWIDQLPT